jgi:hypothetical protein
MSTGETKQKESANKSSETGFMKMDKMMSRMMNMCCVSESRFSDCLAMMKNEMKSIKNQSQSVTKEANNKIEEKKK